MEWNGQPAVVLRGKSANECPNKWYRAVSVPQQQQLLVKLSEVVGEGISWLTNEG